MKTAIIIGATSGIGRALAERLARDGWVVGAAGRREALLQELSAQFHEGTIFPQVMDITKPEATEALDALLAKTGAPDLFLHVSGVGRQNPDMNEVIETWTMETNCTGMARMVSHFIRYVLASGAYDAKHKALIGVVTSVAGTAGLGVSASYSASKKMQITYLSALSQLAHMQKWPILFSDIRPGFVETEILNMDRKYPRLISAEKAAEYILKGLRRKRRIIIFDGRFRLITALWRLIPRCIWERLTFIKN